MFYSTFNNKYFQFYVHYIHYTTCCYRYLGRITAIPDGSKLLSFSLIIQAIPLLGWLYRLPGWSYSFAFTCITFKLYYHCITVLSLPTSYPFPLYGIRATFFWSVIVVLCSLSFRLCLLETLVLRCCVLFLPLLAPP